MPDNVPSRVYISDERVISHPSRREGGSPMPVSASHLGFSFAQDGMKYLPTILIYGCDPELLTIRTWMLEKAGSIVLQAYAYEDAESIAMREQLDAILLCHSVPQADQDFFLQVLSDLRPTIKCLRLGPIYDPKPLCFGTSPLIVLGLEGLIDRVRSLLDAPAAVHH